MKKRQKELMKKKKKGRAAEEGASAKIAPVTAPGGEAARPKTAEAKKTRQVIEVDFFDQRSVDEKSGHDMCWNNRVARVIVDDERMVPFMIREMGMNVEKIIKTRVVRQATKEDEEGFSKLLRELKTIKEGRSQAIRSRSGKPGKKEPDLRRYSLTAEGKKKLSTAKGQAEVIYGALSGSKSPMTVAEITVAAGNKIVTRQGAERVVKFYAAKWTSEKLVEVQP